MKNQYIPIGNKFEASVTANAEARYRIPVSTRWDCELYRKGELIDKWTEGNVITDEGLNAMLDVMFHDATQIETWYIFPFTAGSPATSSTYATSGLTESTVYDEAARVAFNEAAASGKSIANSANKATFTFNDTATITGAALVGGGTDPSVKSDTAGGGTLFCASTFSSSRSVVSTDVLQITCTITLADT